MKRCYCSSCVHMHDVRHYGDKMTCEAFPDGIPKEIYLTGMKHDKPYSGDNGIRYERNVFLDKMTEKEFNEWRMKVLEKLEKMEV